MSTANFKPYIAADKEIPELTIKAMLLGVVFGILFGAASIYLGLKIGLTVSASIPVAVLSIAVFKKLGSATILENNIVQTTASAGEAIAAGITFTMPAMILLGFDLQFGKTILLASIGGIIGILFMIPLRRLFIVQEHGILTYPEGTACADVLIAGETGGKLAKMVFSGLGVGVAYSFCMRVLGLWKDTPHYIFKSYQGATLSGEIAPELLGVGYIIGPRIASIMVSGGIVAWFCLMPMIKFFGQNALLAIPPSQIPIADMGMMDLWKNYIRYIGGGAVVFSGLLCLVKAIPTIWGAFKTSFTELLGGNIFGSAGTLRTERDFPIAITILGAIALVFIIAASPILPSGMGASSIVAALLIIVFGFFFSTVSSRITGLIGSTSNPVSGMVITTLMITSLIFLAMGWKGTAFAATAITIGAVVCIALANAGNTSQDLKTGFLVGATPWKQQVALLIGSLTAAATAGAIMILLHKAGVTHGAGIGSAELPAPKGQLMAIIVQGVLEQSLPWSLVLFGMFIAMTVALLGVESLGFAVGLYLPLSVTFPIFIGGVIHWIVKRMHTKEENEELSPGTLYSAGLIAGGAIMGVIVALGSGFLSGPPGWTQISLLGHEFKTLSFETFNLGAKWGIGEKASEPWGDLAAVLMFSLLCISIYKMARKKLS